MKRCIFTIAVAIFLPFTLRATTFEKWHGSDKDNGGKSATQTATVSPDISADSIIVPDSVCVDSTYKIDLYYGLRYSSASVVVTVWIDTSGVIVESDTLANKKIKPGQHGISYSWTVGPDPWVTYNITLITEVVGGDINPANDTCHAHTVSILHPGVEEKTETTQNARLIVSPNPFLQATSIYVTSSIYPVTNIQVYDASGQFVRRYSITQSRVALGSEFKSGIYFLKAKGYKPVKTVKLR